MNYVNYYTICNLFNLFISENGRIAFVTKEKDADERTKNNSSDGSVGILTRKFDLLSCQSLSICNKMCYDKQSHNICAMLQTNMNKKAELHSTVSVTPAD